MDNKENQYNCKHFQDIQIANTLNKGATDFEIIRLPYIKIVSYPYLKVK